MYPVPLPSEATNRLRRWAPTVVFCAAQFMLIVDVVIVNVALPAIREDLNLPDSRLQLVAVAYTLTFGSLLIVLGRLGDLIGRRRLLIVGLGVFTLASLLTGVAHTEWQLLASRSGQGVGAAFVSPAALALLTTSFTDVASRNRALGYWGAVGSAGAISGQLLGGLLTDVFGWRSIFLINVPIGVLAIVAAIRYVHESRDESARRVNATSAVRLTGGLIAATYALTRLAEAPTDRTGLAVGAMSCVVVTGFWISERTSATPLVDVAVVTTGAVLPANLLLALNAGMLGGSLFFTTLYLQVVLDYGPLEVGVAFAPITLSIMVISVRAGPLTTKYGPRRLLGVGFVLVALGMAILARLPIDGTYLFDVLPPLLLLAAGSGLSYAPLFITGTRGVADADQGLASGLLNSAQELGAAIGVTLLGGIAAAATLDVDDPPAAGLVNGYRAGLITASGLTLAGLLLIQRLPTHPRPNGWAPHHPSTPSDRKADQ